MNTASVFNPSHYGGKDNPYETIKVLEAWLTPDEMIGFCKGNSIKYKSRHREKGGLEDLSKALWYDQYLVQYLASRGLTAHGPNTIAPEKHDPDKTPNDKTSDPKSSSPEPQPVSPPAGEASGDQPTSAPQSALEPLQPADPGLGAGAVADVTAPLVDTNALDQEISSFARRFYPDRSAAA